MSLIKSIATVGGFTMLSRVTGLAREMMIANFLGAGAVADAFFVAFRFPNLFRSLFAEGAFNAAFVPMFTAKLAKEGEVAALSFAERSMAWMALILAAFVGVMQIIMPFAIGILAPGFDEVPGKQELATELARICFPYLLFISLVSIQAGVLNSMGKFAAAAATPVLLNVVSMVGLWALMPYVETPGHALAWGTFAAGIAQLLWLVWHLRKNKMALGLSWPRRSSDVGLLGKRILPGAMGAGVYQINLVISTMVASTVADGAVSYLNYADRVGQLPLGVIGVAVGTALLPLLSRQIASGKDAEALHSQNRAMEFAMLLTLPACIALAMIAEPVLRVLFQHGNFTREDTLATVGALQATAFALPALIAIKVLAPGFFAREDTKTPVRVAAATMVVNVALIFALVGPFAHVGIAMASATSAWFNAIVLGFLLWRRGYYRVDHRLVSRSGRMVLATFGMGAALWGLVQLVWPYAQSTLMELLLLTGMVVLGATVYGVLVILFGASRWSELKGAFRRQR